MLMMFGSALRKAPYERAMPFSDNDLMILISPEIGFRLCNITTESGETFKISDFMEAEKTVFGNVSFSERVLEFADIFNGRVERFFITGKSDYIFFDQEEQKFIRKLMSKKGLSCSVEIYKYSKDGAKKIDFLELPYEEAMYITKFLSNCKVRAVQNCREFYYSNKAKFDETADRRRKYEDFSSSKKQDEMKEMFARYSKLKGLKTKQKVNKYFKALTVKYHPDREGGDSETCMQIRCDFDQIKSSKWYGRLSQE